MSVTASITQFIWKSFHLALYRRLTLQKEKAISKHKYLCEARLRIHCYFIHYGVFLKSLMVFLNKKEEEEEEKNLKPNCSNIQRNLTGKNKTNEKI